MGLTIRVEGANGTTTESLQTQNVAVAAPLVTTTLSAGANLDLKIEVPALGVIILAPGYSERPPVMVLNDLADVEAAPADGSVLQYDDSESRWIAGFRLVFRPALRAYVISDA